jgi:hypothetical protein
MERQNYNAVIQEITGKYQRPSALPQASLTSEQAVVESDRNYMALRKELISDVLVELIYRRQ